jgi:hypothetical protein
MANGKACVPLDWISSGFAIVKLEVMTDLHTSIN